MILLDRLTQHIDPQTNGCWAWTGPIRGADERGRISVEGRPQYAYRLTYEAFCAPIPEGLTVDHLCRNGNCVNPLHLEPVPQGENARRAHLNSETCRNGRHRWIPGRRQCQECRREDARRREGWSARFADGSGYRSRESATCRLGHALTEENIWRHPVKGYVQCRECMRIVNRKAKARYRAKRGVS